MVRASLPRGGCRGAAPVPQFPTKGYNAFQQQQQQFTEQGPPPAPAVPPSPAPPGPGVRRSIAPRRELGTGFTPLCLRSLDVLDLSCNNVDKGSRVPREGSVAPPGVCPRGCSV